MIAVVDEASSYGEYAVGMSFAVEVEDICSVAPEYCVAGSSRDWRAINSLPSFTISRTSLAGIGVEGLFKICGGCDCAATIGRVLSITCERRSR